MDWDIIPYGFAVNTEIQSLSLMPEAMLYCSDANAEPYLQRITRRLEVVLQERP